MVASDPSSIKYLKNFCLKLSQYKVLEKLAVLLLQFHVFEKKMFKGYLRYKTILCHKAALDVQLMNFFIWRKNNVLFSRYRDFCVFVKPADFKIYDVIISIAA